MTAAYRAEGVTYRAPSGAALVDDVTLEAPAGHLLALLGPNGAGKSTLLSLMSGDLRASAGEVTLSGRGVREWPAAELARRRAVLTQANQMAFAFRVRDVVEMGRHPWRGLATEEADVHAVETAIDETDIRHLLERAFPSLSGGEKARVSLARVLAQETPVMLLDEPTAALDLRHQEEVMRMAREKARRGGAVVIVVHDLTLAAAYADSIAIMSRARLAAHGAPRDVLTPALVRDVYGIDVHIVDGPDGSPLVVPVRA
ncbi:heme ABC transporter ATP-binding protein [Demequina aestuarii]|uniref:heme ABC transporter ATP-binding protein n=1 Tax=Demequina aestuarii TaxID=327095 RepID=UPI0007867D75|nr:heme ABC transporter ATP-binding protein [Demequina aestuarii]